MKTALLPPLSRTVEPQPAPLRPPHFFLFLYRSSIYIPPLVDRPGRVVLSGTSFVKAQMLLSYKAWPCAQRQMLESKTAKMQAGEIKEMKIKK